MADQNDQQDQNDQVDDVETTEGDQQDRTNEGGDEGQTASDSAGRDSGREPNPDVEKWKKLSRKNEAELRKVQAKLKEYETASMSESERMQQDRDSYKDRAEKAEGSLQRWDIASNTAPEHATLAQLRKVAKRMSGDSDEALEEDAKELWADFAPAPKPSMPAKPKERLRGGGDPDDEPEDLNPAKLAAKIPRAR